MNSTYSCYQYFIPELLQEEEEKEKYIELELSSLLLMIVLRVETIEHYWLKIKLRTIIQPVNLLKYMYNKSRLKVLYHKMHINK